MTRKTEMRNNTGGELYVKGFFLDDEDYPSNTAYLIPSGGRRVINADVFTKETIQERKPLEIRVKSGHNPQECLGHDVFEDNQAIIFETQNNALVVSFIPRERENGLCKLFPGRAPISGKDR